MSESIYNLVPREYIVPEKKPMHKSVHNPKGHVAGSTFGCHGSTRLPGAGVVVQKDGAMFGPPDPKVLTIVRKKTEEFKDSINEMRQSYDVRRKDPIPTKDDKPIVGIKTNKNFVVANAVEAILQVPKRIDTVNLNYTQKEDFGKVPAYLTKVKEEIRRENEMIERYVKEQMGEVERTPDELEELPEYEREDLLNALKAKWDSVNSKYQKITHHVNLDTTGQIRRKEQLETELQRLESDIERLQKPGPILVRKGY